MFAVLDLRWLAVTVLAANLLLSGVFRHRARKATGTLARGSEPRLLILLRILFGLPLAIVLLAHLVVPGRPDWAFLPLSAWIRLLGIALAAASVPLNCWILRSIGTNISETVLVKSTHQLICHGPYRWVRHPLYASGLLLLIGLAIALASWPMLLLTASLGAFFRLTVIPAEENHLLARFGTRYETYRRSTGALLPRLSRGSST